MFVSESNQKHSRPYQSGPLLGAAEVEGFGDLGFWTEGQLALIRPDNSTCMHQAFRVCNAPSPTLFYKNPSSSPVGEESHQLHVQMRFRVIHSATQLLSGAVTANGVSAPLAALPAELLLLSSGWPYKGSTKALPAPAPIDLTHGWV